jgi:PilZ domain
LPTRERRSETRVPTDDPAVVTILQPGSHPRLECQILNTSKNGVRLGLAVPLEPGVLIQIRLREVITMAEVRYCIPKGNVFQVGARILSTMSPGQEASAG